MIVAVLLLLVYLGTLVLLWHHWSMNGMLEEEEENL